MYAAAGLVEGVCWLVASIVGKQVAVTVWKYCGLIIGLVGLVYGYVLAAQFHPYQMGRNEKVVVLIEDDITLEDRLVVAYDDEPSIRYYVQLHDLPYESLFDMEDEFSRAFVLVNVQKEQTLEMVLESKQLMEKVEMTSATRAGEIGDISVYILNSVGP